MSSTETNGKHKSSEHVPTTLSTSALEQKLKKLREASNAHSQILTQKLASSQSGQNLLHIGTSLSTLPPTLHDLLTQLHPVLSAAEKAEQEQHDAAQKLVQKVQSIRMQQRRVADAQDLANLYADLCAAEKGVQRDNVLRKGGTYEDYGR